MQPEDAQAIALLCAPLRGDGVGAAPLTPAKWADLSDRLAAADLDGPATLMGLSREEIATALSAPPDEAARLQGLLLRGAALAVERERLERLGVWLMTIADDDYPKRLRERLGRQAPPALFGVGERALLESGGLAIVGSRSLDEAGKAYTCDVAAACARQGIAVVSGAARGADQLAMSAAFEEGGAVVGALADALERQAASREIRAMVEERRLALITPYSPAAPFSVGLAMGRNKLIYALADWALVVRADVESGGSWAGAVEALRHRYAPVFVRDDDEAGPAAGELMKKGARAFPAAPWDDLAARLAAAAESQFDGEASLPVDEEKFVQGELF